MKLSARNPDLNGPVFGLDQRTVALDCGLSPARIRVRAEIEIVSGDLDTSGAQLQCVWLGSPNRTVILPLRDLISSRPGEVQVIDMILDRPANADLVTPAGLIVRFYGHTATNGGTTPRGDFEFIIHRLDFEEELASSFASIVQQAVAQQDGWATSIIGLRTQAGSAGAKLELVSLATPDGDASIARLDADEILLEGSVTVPYLTVDGLLRLSDDGAFSAFKVAPEDSADGLFVGKAPDGDGGQRFVFTASREAAGKVQSVSLTNDGFVLENPAFRVSSGAMEPDVTRTASAAVFDLRTSSGAIPTAFSLSQAIGGGGGGGGATNSSGTPGANGGNSVVQLYDGATLKHTFTAAGGVGGASQQSGGPGPGAGGIEGYGKGGLGAHYLDGEDRIRQGETGAPGKVITAGVVDLTGYANPRLAITIGAGGIGGGTSPSKGGDGTAGRVKYRVQAAASIEADVVPLRPSTSGTFAVTNNVAGSFPDLGAGLWYVYANSVFNFTNLSIEEGAAMSPINGRFITFVSSKTPVFDNPGFTGTMAFRHYPMGGRLS